MAESRIVPGQTSAPASILVVKPSSLGDVVLTLPAVARLKHQWPAVDLRWLINPEWAPLLDGNPDVDQVLLFPRDQFRGIRGIVGVPAWAKQLRKRARSELVLDFQGLFRSAFLGRWCRQRQLVGLSDAREGARFFYDRAVAVNDSMHAVDRYLELVKACGINSTEPLSWKLPHGVPPQGFDGHQPFVFLHPFARGSGKSLNDTDIVRFCAALGNRRIVIAGRRTEPLPALDNAIDLVNRTTLLELVWLIRHARYVVSVDSGPMHIAAAMTSRLIGIHTWSDPQKVGPCNRDALVWQRGILATVADLKGARAGRAVPDMRALAACVAERLDNQPTLLPT